MKLPKDEFRKLQQHWYQILADLGFKDNEELKDDELVLKEEAGLFRLRNHDYYSMVKQQEYFRFMSQKANDEETLFRNEVDGFIMMRHAEGAKSKEIIRELASMGKTRSRKAVYLIIRKYEVEWGIKRG